MNTTVNPKSGNDTATALAIQQRCFLVGCVRSGTTLLQSLLAAHPLVTSFPESMFYRIAVGQAATRFRGVPVRGIRSHVGEMLREAHWRVGLATPLGRSRIETFLHEMDRDDCIDMFPKNSRSLKAQSDAFVRILDTLALEQGKTVWIEKSPCHLGYTDIIEREVPGALFIHIVRDGIDVVASITDAANKYGGHWKTNWGKLDLAIQQWNHTVNQTRRQQHKPNHHVVTYERMVDDTPGVLKELCEFMQIEYLESMLDDYRSAARNVILEKSAWKSGVFGEIKRDSGEKFRAIFTEEQQAYIRDRLTPIRPGEFG